MAITIPTIEELKTRGAADLIAAFEEELGIIDNQGQLALIAGSIEDALITAQAGQTFGNDSLLQHISLQVTPISATLNSTEDPFGTLQDWGITFNNPIKLASVSTGNVSATFTGASNIAIDDQWRANDGIVVAATEAVIIAGAGVVSIPAASVEKGGNTNLAEADQLTAISSIINMETDALVDTGGFTGGQDDEEQEPFRARLLIAIRAHTIGSQADRYQLAALKAAGVTRAFVEERAPTIGSVTVRFMMDIVRAAFNGIPQGTDGIIPSGPASTGDQKLVEDQIIAAQIRPPAAQVHIVSPIALSVAVTLSDLQPNTTEVQAAINAEVKDFFSRETEPGSVLTPSQISAAISAATGEISHVLSDPTADIIPTPGELPILLGGEVTFP